MKKPKTRTSLKKRTLLLGAIAAAGLFGVTATRSDAFILNSLKRLGESAVSIVEGAVDYHVGNYFADLADKYLPDGLDFVAGALGLPKPGELSDELDAEAERNETAGSDTLDAETKKGSLASSTSKAIGDGVLSEEGQAAYSAQADATTATAKASSDVADQCANTTITQEAVKCLATQNANSAALQKAQIDLTQAMLQQQAVQNLTLSTLAEQGNRDEREDLAKKNNRANANIQRAVIFNQLLGE